MASRYRVNDNTEESDRTRKLSRDAIPVLVKNSCANISPRRGLIFAHRRARAHTSTTGRLSVMMVVVVVVYVYVYVYSAPGPGACVTFARSKIGARSLKPGKRNDKSIAGGPAVSSVVPIINS